METIYHYSSVIKALEELKSKGFTIDYNIQEEDLVAHPDQYKIVAIYQNDGDTNPDEEAIVYGIEAVSGEKGVFVSGAAANSNSEADTVLHKIRIKTPNNLAK